VSGSDDERAFLAEVVRIQERYAVEIVERFGICPWARHARLAGAVERPVLLQRTNDPELTLALLAALEADPRAVPVAIVAYPLLPLAPRGFDEFASRVRQLDQARHGGKPVYVAATFHPDYPLDERSAASLVPWFRRSPDPSLQLVRLSALEEARGRDRGKVLFDFSPAAWRELLQRNNTPTVAERIAEDNRATLDRVGRAAFDAIVRDILDDRARSYARFATFRGTGSNA